MKANKDKGTSVGFSEDDEDPVFGLKYSKRHLMFAPKNEKADEDKWDDIFDDWNIDQTEISQRDWFKLNYHAPIKKQ